jgi:hypothetical protein
MTARQIQIRIIRRRFEKSFLLPNYTPSQWFECDIFEVTKAGYFREYEIKLTYGDFKADRKKEKTKVSFAGSEENGQRWTRREPRIGTKHQMLADKALIGPSQFWFVCPENSADVIPLSEIPSWAGLIYIPIDGGEIEIVKAPKLHRSKHNPEIIKHARGVCYYRFHRLFIKSFKKP